MPRTASRSGLPPNVAVPVTVLAIAGVVDLLFERIVYRIGIHVPKDASAMRAYRGATWVGDGAFRFVMVLAVFAAIAVAVEAFRKSRREPTWSRGWSCGLPSSHILHMAASSWLY